MDAVDAPTFERITRIPGSFETVLRGVRAAREAGLTPSKSTASCSAASTTTRSRPSPTSRASEDVVVRFIEFMPLEEGRLWTPEIVVPLKEIVERISAVSCHSSS
jgi:cyclic pyranopterin phosphate synthase